MSQSRHTLLEEVTHWDFDQCKETVNEVLPQLLLLLQETNELDLTLDCLHVLCNSFLTCLPTEEFEKKFITSVILKISDIFESRLGSISYALEDSNLNSGHIDLIVSSLKIILQIFNNLLVCLQFLNAKTTVMLENIYNLPGNIVQLLKKTYFHIKESKDVYAEYLDMLEEPLRNMIKLANAIQVQFLKLMENITPCLTLEKDVQLITNFCEELMHLSQVAYLLDFKIVVGIWKTYTRLIVEWKPSIIDRLDVAESIRYICNKTEEETEALLSLTSSSKEFSRVVKICNFNLKIIISICEEFCNYLGDCVPEVIHLILVLYRLSPPLLDDLIPQEQSEEIHRSIVIGIEPFVSSLLTDRQFIYKVTTTEENSFSSDLKFSSCMMNLFILRKLPTLPADIQAEWIKPSNLENSIIYVAFTSIQKCYAEMYLPVFLPGIVSDGKPHKMISIYGYVGIHLCSFISSLTADYFPLMEKIMFDLAMKSSGIFAVLINDLWCFIARYGTADLCYSHCCLLADIVEMGLLENRNEINNVKYLLGRMVKFLAPKHKVSFMDKYPVLGNMRLWSCLPLNAFLTEDSAKDQLVYDCFKQLHQSYEETMTKEKYFKLCDLLELTNNVICEYNGKISREQLQIMLNWFQILNTDDIATTPTIQNILGKLIILAMNTLPFLQEHQLLQMLEYLFQMWNLQSDYVHVAIIQFLKHWKDKYVSPSSEQMQIFSKLSRLFNYSLKTTNPVLHYEALCAYSTFAFSTPHAALIPICIGEDQQVQSSVQRFITNEIPNPLNQNDVLLILKKQQKNLQESNSLPECNVKNSNADFSVKDCNNDDTKDAAKYEENMIYSIIDVLDNNINKLKNIQQQQKFSENLLEKLRALYNEMGSLCK